MVIFKTFQGICPQTPKSFYAFNLYTIICAYIIMRAKLCTVDSLMLVLAVPVNKSLLRTYKHKHTQTHTRVESGLASLTQMTY